MDVNVKDSKFFFQEILDFFCDRMALIDGKVGIHLQDNVQIDIASVGPSALVFHTRNLREF